MANCSFIKATDARNRARNDTLIWTEICEIQAAILAAIDSNQYSTLVAGGTPFTTTGEITAATLVSGGSGYTTVSATAAIDPNGTGGTGAVISPVLGSGGVVNSFTISNGGSGYAPVSATASVQTASNLNDTQDETNFTGVAGNGTFVAGDEYFVGEVITLSENSTVTVDAISNTGVVTIAAQDETNYDGVGANGSVPGGLPSGANYAALDEITLTDGTVITVDSVDGSGGVLTFTVTSSSTSSFATGSTLIQLSASDSLGNPSAGSGFSITTGTNNETAVGTVTQFTIASPATDPMYLGQVLDQGSTTGIGSGFSLTPTTLNVTTITHVGTVATLTPIVTNGAITSVVINNGGTGYLAGQPVLIAHPNGSGATASIASVDGSGTITGITVTTAGSGYETATAQVTVTHPSGQGFEGTVQVTSGVVTGIAVVDGGFGYSTVFPTITISDATGSGAQLNVTGVSGGAITSIQLADGGSGYSTPSLNIVNSDGVTANNTASITLTLEANTFGTDPLDYYAVLSGQATDVVIADQIQYVLDYFTALGYNIRAQVNPATGDTLQWQIIW